MVLGMSSLTSKQEQFAQLVANGMSQADAYREAYNADDMQDNSIYVNASKLANDTKVALRIADIQAGIREKLQVSRESLTRELEEARLVGAAKEQGAAMVAASMGKAKLHGLIVDKQEVDHKGLTVTINGPEADL